jgi:hypothetical protein
MATSSTKKSNVTDLAEWRARGPRRVLEPGTQWDAERSRFDKCDEMSRPMTFEEAVEYASDCVRDAAKALRQIRKAGAMRQPYGVRLIYALDGLERCRDDAIDRAFWKSIQRKHDDGGQP